MAAQISGPVIELRGLARTYPGPPPVPALRPADLVIETGDYVAVTGPSGSGKSTLLHLLGLLDVPTEGSYLLDGLDTSTLSDRDRSALRGRRIGFVFQAFHLLPYRTALENVLLAELYNQTSRGDRARAAAGALDAVGLGHRLDALPTTLSGGECQRGGDSTGAGEPAEPPAVRRADREPGLAERGRADGAARPAERGRLHHRGDHARRPGGGARRPGHRHQRRGAVRAS
jgi:predicted ABC-type transport system involved in lysophospholipase L1 biosynthesis ATPase subunit